MNLVKNSFFNLLLTISNVLFPLLVIPYITRVLLVSEVGKIMYTDSITQYLILISALGIPFYGVREIAKLSDQKEKISNIVIELVIIQLILSVISALFLIFLIPRFGSIIDSKLISLSCILIIGNSFFIEWYFQGIQNFKYIALRSIIFRVISIFLIVLLVKQKTDGLIYYLIITVLTISCGIMNISKFLKTGFYGIKELNFKRHFKPLLMTFGISFSISVYAILDTIILGYFYGQENIGYYTISLKIVKTFWVIINAFGIVMISHTSNLIKEDKMDEVSLNTSRSLNVILTFTIPFIMFCQIFPKEILWIIGGKSYEKADDLIRILSFLPLIIGVCNIYGTQFLMVYNKEKYVLRATLIALIISLLSNLILVPHLKEIGTGISNVLSEIVVCVIILFFAKKFLKNQIDKAYMIQISISTISISIFYLIFISFLSGFIVFFLTFTMFITTSIVLQMFYFRNDFLNKIIIRGLKIIKIK